MLSSIHLNLFRRFNPKIVRVRYIVITIFSAFALLAAFQLSVDRLEIAKHPEAKLACSINSVLNCASVMKTPQAEIFGFPNSFLGMMAFSVLVFFGLSALLGTKYSKNVLRLVAVAVAMAFAFALWLFFDSVYVIQILCPWCLLTTFSTIVVTAAVTGIVIEENILNLPRKYYKKAQKIVDGDFDKLFFATIVVVLIIMVVAKFGDSLLG